MNEYWINFTLIVSGLIIFLAVVTPSILQVILSLVRKDAKEGTNDSKNLRSAVWAPIVFIGTFMILLGVCVFSLKFSYCSRLLDFMSLASAIVSIILAVLTIVYSYYTTGASVRNIENVQDSAKELNGTAQKLGKLSNEIDKDAKSLSHNIERILERLNHIETHTKQITDYIDSSAIDYTDTENIKTNFDDFLTSCPRVAIMFLYACGKVQSNQDIEVDQLFDGPAPFNMMYFTGLVAPFKMLGLIELQILPDKFIVRVERVNENLSKAVVQKVDKMSKTDSFIKEMKEKIDSSYAL